MRCKHQPKYWLQKQQGLTLVELLIAISILAFVAVLGWRGLDTIVRTRLALNQELQQTHGMQLAFAQLQTDCANVVDAELLDGRSPVVIQANHITLARKIQIEAQPTRLQLVIYRWKDGVLTRQATALTRDLRELEKFWSQTNTMDLTAQPVTLQSGLRSMQLRVWSNDGRGWRSSEQATATSAAVSKGSLMNPQAGTTASQTNWSGLEVSLGMPGSEASLSKIFLLGAV
jgi:general secretion pathway protein J